MNADTASTSLANHVSEHLTVDLSTTELLIRLGSAVVFVATTLRAYDLNCHSEGIERLSRVLLNDMSDNVRVAHVNLLEIGDRGQESEISRLFRVASSQLNINLSHLLSLVSNLDSQYNRASRLMFLPLSDIKY